MSPCSTKPRPGRLGSRVASRAFRQMRSQRKDDLLFQGAASLAQDADNV
jgi:hypothetical protein